MGVFRNRAVAGVVVLGFLIGAAFAAAGPSVSLVVDATEAPRKILHARLRIPASAGTLTLYYPKWLPGEHAPTGPINDLTGLKFSASGQTLKWRRDLKDGWIIHVEVPAGQNEVQADLDYVEPATLEEGFSSGSSATDKLVIVSWNQLLLYPAGYKAEEITFNPSLRIPEGWKYATPLPITNANGNDLHFAPVPLTTLIDSPVLSGAYLKAVALAAAPQTELDVAADSAAALDVPQEVWDKYKNLVVQAAALFGAQHYRDYHFLYTLSDHVAHFGLEHHEADDSRVGERGLTDETARKLDAGLLPHEYVHSWNGKYRRPIGLATPDYQVPMQTDLLWVYEGLTTYLGNVLTARSGLWTPDQYRDALAETAATLDHLPGRTWRNLQDTADAAPQLYFASQAWYSWRRGVDFYSEDDLNWLWVDVIIRQQSGGKKIIDDFCHVFHGGKSGGPPEVKTYNFDDVVNTLNGVVAYDWRGFWTDRLTNHGPGAPLGGIEGSGWKLVYDETPSDLFRSAEHEYNIIVERDTLGLQLREDGGVVDTIEGMAAAKAGIGPGMKVIAVNGRKFSADGLHDAIKAAKGSSDPIELLVENTDYFKSYKLDYHGGEKYPHLVRDESKPDLLSEIIKAR
jgi:predicted metalloprotease with PDZ domain